MVKDKKVDITAPIIDGQILANKTKPCLRF
jgi:hypothetical protein